MTFFREKFPFPRPKFLMTFLVIDQVFLIFRIFTVLNVVYDPFFTRKATFSEKNSLMTPFYNSVRTFARIRQHYFSKYWGDGCMGRPPPHILGGPSPQSSLGLRPCVRVFVHRPILLTREAPPSDALAAHLAMAAAAVAAESICWQRYYGNRPTHSKVPRFKSLAIADHDRVL